MLAAMKSVQWKHFGPEREVSKPVPPTPRGNSGYALLHDPKRGCVVYVRANEEYALEAWTFDGEAWSRQTKTGGRGSDECHAHWDGARDAIVLWSTQHDIHLRRNVPKAAIVDASGVRVLETKGEPPLIEPQTKEHFFLSSNIGCFVTRDEARGAIVCVTRHGIWELDAKDTWSKKHDAGAVIPPEWHNDAGGVWDPVGKRCFFWVEKRGDGYPMVYFSWDGEKLEALPAPAPAAKLKMGFNTPCGMYTAHPKRGVIAWLGANRGMHALAGTKWERLPDAANPPPLMCGRFATGRPRIAYDPKRDLYVVGPGYYYEDKEAVRDSQRVFWVLRDSAWERMGVVARPSPIESLRQRAHAMVGGTWCACDGPRVMAWAEGGWRELVGEKAAEKAADGDRSFELASTPQGLALVSSKGGVLAFDGKRWERHAKRSPAFKDRSEFLLVHDRAAGRLVAWGGEVKNRRVNDTLFFDGKKWTAAKKTSPMPKDYKTGRDATKVDFTGVFDTTLGAVVRFGKQEVAVLQGEDWVPSSPKGYAALVSPYAAGHFPAHDPTTGETLVIDFHGERVVRFDLGGCVEVAKIAWPAERVKAAADGSTNVAWLMTQNIVFDPTTRAIHAQDEKDRWGRWVLELGPIFDAAKKLGPRKTLGAPKKDAAAPAHLYRFAKGKLEHWSGKAADAEAKRKAGWLAAGALGPDVLAAIGTRSSCAIKEGKKLGKLPLAKHAVSRVGGLPSGVSLDDWPKYRGKPMGFLFQLLTGDALAKHAAVAVFCSLDGDAAENEDGAGNAVVLLDAKALKRAPAKAPPKGVPVLAARELVVQAPLPEIDEAAVEALAARDPEMGAAFDRFQAKQKVQDANTWSKLGGAPAFVQGDDAPKGFQFVAQLDVETTDTDEWEDAGLMGCVFVFAKGDGKKAVAFWQYT